jgi:hypothetical protein
LFFGLRNCHTADGAHLAVGELTGGERLANQRQVEKPSRYADMLTGADPTDRASPAQPLGAGLGTPVGPAAALIEFGDEQQPAARRSGDVSGELTDLTLKLLQTVLTRRFSSLSQ